LDKMKLNREEYIILIQLYLRSFFIQCLWNYQGMQNMGLGWMMLVVAKEKPASIDIYNRISEYYNGHPYLCGYIAGAGAALEFSSQGALHSRLKNGLIGALGAVGDRVFWKTLKPISGIIACLGLLIILNNFVLIGVTFLLISLLGYNSIHLWIRWKGLIDGYKLQCRCAKSIKSLDNNPVVKAAGFSSSFLIGILFGGTICTYVYSTAGLGNVLQSHVIGISVLGGVFLISLWLPARKYSMSLMLLVITLLSYL
jgi:mannose/fructose/N-acetylgalactosamine-specific phosphotransferase system component IID